MSKKIVTFIVAILAFTSNIIFAQDIHDDFSRALELYQAGRYTQSKILFEKVLANINREEYSITSVVQNLFVVSCKQNNAKDAYKYGKMYLEAIIKEKGIFSEDYMAASKDVSQANDVYVSELWYRSYYFTDSLTRVEMPSSLYLHEAFGIDAEAMKAFEESRYEDAIKHFEAERRMYRVNGLEESTYYASASAMLGECYKEHKQYDLAEEILLSARSFYILSGKIHDTGFALVNNYLSQLYNDKGLYVKSQELIYEKIQLATLFHGESSEEYFVAKLALAFSLCHQYNYTDAKQIMEDLLYRWDGKVDSWIFASLQLSYTFLCFQLCLQKEQDEIAIKACNDALSPTRSVEILKEWSPIFHSILAVIYSKQGMNAEAISHVEQAKNFEDITEPLNKKIVEPIVCQILSTFYLSQNDVDQAITFLEKLKSLPPLGITPLTYSELIANLGFLYSMSETQKAESIPTIESAIQMVQDNYGLEHPRVSGYFQQLLAIKHNLGYTIPDDEINRFIQISSDIIKSTNIFSVKERESFIKNHDQINNLIFELGCRNGLYQQLFDYSALRKGFLLSSDLEFRQYFESLPNSVLRAKYEKFCTLKSAYANSIFGIQQKNLWGIDSSVLLESFFQGPVSSDLYLEYKNLEIDILSEYKPRRTEYSSADLVKFLGANEAVIEFINYTEGSMSIEADSVHRDVYGAIILQNVNKKPLYTYVELGNSEELRSIVDNRDVYSSGTTVSHDFQKFFWEKISKTIKQGSTVYFSPCGYLYQLAIENTFVNDDTPGEDFYSLHRISSARHFPVQEHFLEQMTTAVLYGGIDYENQTQQVEHNVLRSENPSQIDSSIIRGSGIKKWDYLPGTVKEIENVAKILNKHVSLSLYTKDRALESDIKNQSGSSSNIMHFATHGFYAKSNDENKRQFFNENIPLSRSGIILSGANYAWTGKALDVQGNEDGILTSEEVANLDLSRTNIVILSACETGLGDITNEGVLGLQRGFKNAGVETIIMSLWKIDDKVSAEFMKRFYALFADGLSSNEAFKMAKNKIRTEYPDPYYWAGFIMLD